MWQLHLDSGVTSLPRENLVGGRRLDLGTVLVKIPGEITKCDLNDHTWEDPYNLFNVTPIDQFDIWTVDLLFLDIIAIGSVVGWNDFSIR